MSSNPPQIKTSRHASVLRYALGGFGLVLLAVIVVYVGPAKIYTSVRGGLIWLPVIFLLDVPRIALASLASYFGFGPHGPKIPKSSLFRAHVLGYVFGSIAPAPSVVNETIKATLLAPYTGAGPAAAVGFINQSAVLIAVGVFSIPCATAVLAIQGPSIWFWACVIHAVAVIGSGIGLHAVTRAGWLGRLLVKRSPKLADRAKAFHEHSLGVKLGALRPTLTLIVSRFVQLLQWSLLARAVGIDVTLLRAMATQGVQLVATAVGVMVPGGFGTTEGAFTLAADLLSSTVERTTSIALLARCSQFLWVFVASLVALLGPKK